MALCGFAICGANLKGRERGRGRGRQREGGGRGRGMQREGGEGIGGQTVRKGEACLIFLLHTLEAKVR